MSRWDKSRSLEWGSAHRPKVSNKLGIPFPNEGSDGDIQVRQTSLGGKLFAKLGGRWHDAPLSLSTGSSVYTVDEINLTGKINIKGSGTANIMMGRWATSNPDVGNENIVIGSEAGRAMESGSQYNICIGSKAGFKLTTGESNTMVGRFAGYHQTTGGTNTYVGVGAGLGAGSGTYNSSHNVAIGEGAYVGAISGGYNTMVGVDAGWSTTTGARNICLGYICQTSAVSGEDQIAIGYNCQCTGNDTITIGIGSNTASLGLDGSDEDWSAASDERFKENITTSTAGLSFINDLRPITYNWKKEKYAPVGTPYYKEDSDEPCLGHEYGTTLHGFIAQEVKTVIDNHSEIKEGFKMWQEYDNGVQAIAKGHLVPMLVKAVQELSTKIDEMQVEINNLT